MIGPVLIVWSCLPVSLRRLSKSLDQAGYVLKPAPMRIPSGVALGVWPGLHLLIIGALPLLFSRLHVNNQTPVYDPNIDYSSLRAELLELGFPEGILTRLDDSELFRFQEAYDLKEEGYHNDESRHPDGMPSGVTVEAPVRDERHGFHMVYLAYLR